MADGLFRLRHDAVVGGDDEHGDVRDVGAAGAHRRERLVPRRIDERDRPPVLLDAVGADVLRDAPLLVRRHVDADDAVQQRGLAVVDVAEEGDDGRAGLAAGRVVVLMVQRAEDLVLQRHLAVEVDLHAQLDGQQFGHLRIEVGGDVAHRPHRQQLGEDGPRGHADRFGEGADGAGEVDDDFALSRRGGLRSRAADVRRPPRRGGAGGVFFFAGTAVDAGDPLPLQLPLLASAEGGGPALLFLRDRFGDAGAAARPLAAGRRRLRRETGFRRGNGGRFSRRALLRRVLLRLLLLVLAEVLGKRLAARRAWRELHPAGA